MRDLGGAAIGALCLIVAALLMYCASELIGILVLTWQAAWMAYGGR